jgi:transcriptional regulator with GAF, ATPase, and Fis domain
VKLLRILQEQEFEPVGSSQTKKVDVRVIAATNRNLEAAVAEGRFRADLYYRLNVFPIEAPPLRDRREDIPQLAEYFVAQCARRFGKTIDAIEDESVNRLQRYSWPGNVRELQNVVERAVVLADGPTLTFTPEMLPALTPSVAAPAAATEGGTGSLVDAVDAAHRSGAREGQLGDRRAPWCGASAGAPPEYAAQPDAQARSG